MRGILIVWFVLVGCSSSKMADPPCSGGLVSIWNPTTQAAECAPPCTDAGTCPDALTCQDCFAPGECPTCRVCVQACGR